METLQIQCNCCGNKLNDKSEYVNIRQQWGYFSKKDGMIQSGYICEACFEKIVADFQIPLQEEEATELL